MVSSVEARDTCSSAARKGGAGHERASWAVSDILFRGHLDTHGGMMQQSM